MLATDNFKETLKQQADIVRVIGDYVKLRKAGARDFTGLCPFHAEKTPSFSVSAARQFYYCFGCAASGDVFTFVQKVENISFPEAVRLIAQKLGVAMPKVAFSSPAEARDAQVRMALLDVHVRATQFFQESLRRSEGASAREYLKERGLDEETIAKFRIGFAPDSGFVLRDALRREFDEEVLRESGLFSWKEDSRQPSAVSRQEKQVLPLRQAQGQDDKAGEGDKAPRNDTAGEHEIPRFARDDKSGGDDKKNGVAPAAIYSKFRNRVMFPICNDQGKVIAFTGRTLATERTLGLLVEEEFNIRVVTLETGFDPDLFIRRKGKDAYGEALKHSQKYFDYLIDRARAQFPARNADSKVKAVNHLLPHIQRVPSRIVRDELAMEISQKLGIDSAVLRQELKHVAGNRSATAVKAPAEMQITGAERVLIRALASGNQMLAGEGRSSAREGTDEEFDPCRQAQFALQSEHLYEGLTSQSLIEALLLAGVEAADVMTLPKTEEDRRLLASILMSEAEELTPETVEGAVKALRRIYLRHRLEEAQGALQRPGVSAAEKQALLQEKVRLKRALMDPGLGEGA